MINAITTFYNSRFRQGSFGRNVLVMFAGTALGQLGGVIVAPLLTRLYAPDMFGILGFFAAAMSIASVLSALRYELALPLAASQEDAANLLAVCIVALICTTGIGCVIIFTLPSSLLGELAAYRWLMPAGFFCIGAYQVMVYFATREAAFHTIARTKLYQGTIGPMTQIGLGFANAGTWGLIIGFIAGQSTGVGTLFSKLIVKPRGLVNVSLGRMGAMARRFLRFPLLSSWSGIVEAAGGSYALLVAMPLLYSNTIAGFVFLTDRVIGRPLYLISTSILQVYVGDISRLRKADPDAMHSRFLQLAVRQSMIVACWLALVNLAAPWVFPVVFGYQWSNAVPYLQVLSIAYLPQMVMHALVHTLQVLERQAMSALWEGGRFIAVCTVFAVNYARHSSALYTLFIYSIVQALAHVVLFLLMYQSIQSLRKEDSHA